MKVTCFNDDSMFVLTFEGLTREQKMSLAKTYSAQWIGDVEAKVETKPEAKPEVKPEIKADAKPETKAEKPSEEKQKRKNFLEVSDKPMQGRKIVEGPLKGYTVIGVLREKGDSAFRILSHLVDHTLEMTEEELAYVKQVLNLYVKARFNIPDENFKSYASKLDDAGCDAFISTFESIITKRMWQQGSECFGVTQDNFKTQNLEMKKKFIFWVCCSWGKNVRKNQK